MLLAVSAIMSDPFVGTYKDIKDKIITVAIRNKAKKSKHKVNGIAQDVTDLK